MPEDYNLKDLKEESTTVRFQLALRSLIREYSNESDLTVAQLVGVLNMEAYYATANLWMAPGNDLEESDD